MNNELKFRDYSMLVGKKHADDWYEWCVFLDGDATVLNRIASVEYTLHPTFTDPIRLVRDRSTRFALFSNGWGGFTIRIDVEWQDGSHTKTTHVLRLATDNWPRTHEPVQFGSGDEEVVYRALFSEKYRWRKTETIARLARLPGPRTTDLLKELAKRNLVRKASFLSVDGGELWGPTARVGLPPRL